MLYLSSPIYGSNSISKSYTPFGVLSRALYDVDMTVIDDETSNDYYATSNWTAEELR